MRQEWAYRVTVSGGSVYASDLIYEGKFVRFTNAEKVARRKLEQHEGTGAHVNIYSRWDGSCITYVA